MQVNEVCETGVRRVFDKVRIFCRTVSRTLVAHLLKRTHEYNGLTVRKQLCDTVRRHPIVCCVCGGGFLEPPTPHTRTARRTFR